MHIWCFIYINPGIISGGGEKKSLLVFQQTCKTSIEQQATGQLLCILTRSVMVPTVIVNIMFCTTVENCKPRITVYGRKNWNDVPQNNKFVCAIPDFYRHKISSDTTESRLQPANNCREATLTGFVYDSMSTKTCLHLRMQNETLNLKQN